MMRRPVSVLMLSASLLAACSGGTETPSSTTGAAAPPSAPAPAAQAAPAGPGAAPGEAQAAPAAANLPEADVRAVLDRWLAAQNGGDFAQYEPLYASRFSGVRRTRNQVRRFDRQGWIEDRRRMFARPMQVVARDVTIAATPVNADVTFTQVWSSGSYSDEGRKRLLIVKEGDALRIGIEEMLESRITDDLEARIAAGQFLVVDGPTDYVVLGTTRSNGTGPYRHQVDGSTYFARRAPDATLAARLAPMTGRAVKLVGANGSCDATLGEPTLLRVVTPHFGTTAVWNGQGDGTEEQAGPPVPPARVAMEAFQLGQSTLVAAPVVGSCTGAIATFADGAAAAALPATELAAPQRSTVIAAFDRAHAVSAEELEGEERPGAHRIEARTLPDGALLVQVSRYLPGGCGGENAFEVYRLAGTQLTTLSVDAPFALAFQVGGAVHLVTGRELEGSRALYRVREAAEKITEADFTFLDCPC